MIKPHEKLTPPADHDILWRYMDFTKLVDLLHKSALYFTQVGRMDDKFECAWTKPSTEAARERWLQEYGRGYSPEKREEIRKMGFKNSELYRKKVFVSCWHRNEYESAAMWKLYVKGDEGIAIRTTFKGIKTALAKSQDDVYATVVKYIDYSKDTFDTEWIFPAVAHKRLSFKHEDEVRLFWYATYDVIKEIRLPTGETIIETPPGRLISLALPDLIQEVYVSPGSQDWFRDLVEAVVRKYGFDFPVKKSPLNDGPVW